MELGEEQIPPGEDEAIVQVVRVSEQLLDRTTSPVRRDQHPKHHGCVRAEFRVLPELPETYRVGLFREPRTYPAWIRFSNGGQQDDRKPDAHGMAVKLMGVEGPKVLDGERDATTHDFVMIDNPVFFLRDVIDYGVFSSALLKAKGKEPSAIRSSLFFLPAKFRELGTVTFLYFLPRRLSEFGKLLKFVGKKIDNPLTTRYWSTTPYRFGPGRAMKFSARPVAGPTPAPAGGSPDFLREAMAVQLARGDVEFEFLVQLQTDAGSMPIEDPTVPWDEALRRISRSPAFRSRSRISTTASATISARTCRSPPGTRSPTTGRSAASIGPARRFTRPCRGSATS